MSWGTWLVVENPGNDQNVRQRWKSHFSPHLIACLTLHPVIHDELVKCIRGEADSPRVQHIPLWLEPVFSLAVVLTLPTTWTPSLGPFSTESPTPLHITRSTYFCRQEVLIFGKNKYFLSPPSVLQSPTLGWWVNWVRFYIYRWIWKNAVREKTALATE